MKKCIALAVFAVMTFVCFLPSLVAQETKSSAKQPDPIVAYRLDFSLNELEDGKKINTRQYSLNLTDGTEPQVLKIGTRVPIRVEEGKNLNI